MQHKKVIKIVVQIIIIGLIFFFLGKTIIDNWQKVSTYKWSINCITLVTSIFVLLIALSILPLGSLLVLRLMEKNMSFGTIYRIYFYSQLPKYLPGKVWMFFARVYYYNNQGISKTESSVCMILETVLIIVSGFLIFVISLLFWQSPIPLEKNKYLLILLFFILVLCLHPSIFLKIVNCVLTLLRQNSISIVYSVKKIIQIVAVYCIFWIVLGTGFYIFVNAIVTTDIRHLPILTGSYAIAWIIGFFSVFAPGGIGIREGSLSVLLGLSFSSSIAVIIALLARLWWTIGELISIGIAYLFGK